MRAIFKGRLDDFAFRDVLWQHDSLFIILQTSEDFVGITIEQTYECHPFLLVVLEPNNVAFQLFRANFRYFGLFAKRFFRFIFLHFCPFCVASFLLVFLRNGYHHARTAAVSINGTALATALPRLNIEPIHQGFVHIVGQIDRHGDAVVHPFLNGSLHFHLHQPVHIIGRSFIIR